MAGADIRSNGGRSTVCRERRSIRPHPNAGILIVENASTVVMLITRACCLRRFVLKTARSGIRLKKFTNISLGPVIAPSIIAVVLFSLASCSTNSEDTRFDREDARILARERFEVKVQNCRRSHGVMIIHAQATRIKKQYIRSEMNSAKCVRW